MGKIIIALYNNVVLLTIRRGRHGFYGRGRGKNFTAQGRRNDKFRPGPASVISRFFSKKLCGKLLASYNNVFTAGPTLAHWNFVSRGFDRKSNMPSSVLL